jgi:DNA-binding LacI/PurR family transcriptional regulator
MGQKAAELLLGRLRGERLAKTVVFEPQLVVRRSTAAPSEEVKNSRSRGFKKNK